MTSGPGACQWRKVITQPIINIIMSEDARARPARFYNSSRVYMNANARALPHALFCRLNYYVCRLRAGCAKVNVVLELRFNKYGIFMTFYKESLCIACFIVFDQMVDFDLVYILTSFLTEAMKFVIHLNHHITITVLYNRIFKL